MILEIGPLQADQKLAMTLIFPVKEGPLTPVDESEMGPLIFG
jgi:hypothetical protein